ncbi:MAG: outer membrane beta-barrel protein [Nitrospirota bacterium]
MQVVTNDARKVKVRKWTAGVAMAVLAFGAPTYAGAEEGMMEGLKGVTVTGYVEAQYNYNFNDPIDQTNAFRAFDYQANSFTFNMAELAFTKAAGDTPGFGLVLNYGQDAQLTSSAGSMVSSSASTTTVTDSTGALISDGSGGFVQATTETETSTADDFDIQQAFITEKMLGGGLELKFGKFATLAGAEVIEGPLNFNISRSYLFFYAIPFTHTGLRGSFATPVEGLSVTAGVNNGWDVVNDGDKGKTGELQVAFAPMDMLSLGLTGYYGPEASFTGTDARSVVDLLATIKPMGGLTVVFNYDRGTQEDASAAGSALWQGYAVYVNLPVGEKHAVTLRGEVFDDQDGFRTGVTQTLREVTLTGACKMKENLEWRLELRHDESNQDVFVDDQGAAEDAQNTIAVAAYYTF